MFEYHSLYIPDDRSTKDFLKAISEKFKEPDKVEIGTWWVYSWNKYDSVGGRRSFF